MTTTGALTVGAIVVTGLMAGLFFGWAVSVIPGTKLIGDRAYIETMQSINRAIVNPGFVLPFMGAPIVLAAAAIAHGKAGNTRAAWILASAAATYVVGMLGVTMGGNVPLNNALEAFSLDAASDGAIDARRGSYERLWNRWHTVRTIAVIGSFALASVAAIVESD